MAGLVEGSGGLLVWRVGALGGASLFGLDRPFLLDGCVDVVIVLCVGRAVHNVT